MCKPEICDKMRYGIYSKFPRLYKIRRAKIPVPEGGEFKEF